MEQETPREHYYHPGYVAYEDYEKLPATVVELLVGIQTNIHGHNAIQAQIHFDPCTTNHEEHARMRLLTPDGNRPQREDFIWCLPVAFEEWGKLYELSHKFRTITPNGVCYLHRIGRGRQRIVLVLQAPEQTEDDITEGCAWMRLIKDIRQPIYVVPYKGPMGADATENTLTDIIASHMGVNPKMIQSLDSLDEDKP